MKAPKKEDIIAQFNTLQASFDDIEKKNSALEKKKKTWSRKIRAAQKLLNYKKKLSKFLRNKLSEEMPTKRKRSANIYFKNRRSKSEVYLCGDCEYIADCINDFNDHTHSQDEDHEN